MPAKVGSPHVTPPALYWRMREQELTRLCNDLRRRVEECADWQRKLVALSDTAKLRSEQWEQTMSGAARSLRAARTARTRVRKQVASMRDTLRIRKNLADGAPAGLSETLDNASQQLELLEAHGY